MPMLLSNLNLLATAPDGVAKLRELILTLAVQGKLLPQDSSDEPASVLLKKSRAEKDRLIADGKIKRDKSLAEIAEEERPFELPVGWEWVRLNTLLQKIGAGSTPLGGKEVYTQTGVKFLRSQNVWDDGLRLAGVAFIKPETHAKMAGTTVLPDDLLFNITGASIGRCAVVPIDFDEANVSQHVTIVRTVLPTLNAFLHKVLVSRHVQQTVMDVQVGVSREGLSIAKLGSFLIPLPPLAEQSRIVTRVEELMRLCDALQDKARLEATQHEQLVGTLLGTLTAASRAGAPDASASTPGEPADPLHAKWQRVAPHFDLLLDRPEAVDALEQTIVQLAVRGLLVPQDPQDEPASVLLKKIRAEKDRLILEGKIKRDKPLPPIAEDEKPFELPQGWEWCQLDELVTIRGGKRVANGYQLSSVPTDFIYVRVSDMKDGSIDDSDLRYLDAQMQSTISRYIITKDDIYMTIVGATIGKCGLVPERFDGMNLTENAARLTPHLLAKDYLFRLLTSEFCQSQFFGKTKQVGVQKMALNRLAATLIPLPPLAEQSRIVARVASLRALCADLRQRLTTARTQQALLAQALVENSV